MFNRARHPVWYVATALMAACLLFMLALVSPAQALAPTLSVSVIGVANTSVSLSWTLSGTTSTLRYYWVEYGVVGQQPVYAKNVSTATSTTITSLLPGTLHWFKVKASTTTVTVVSDELNVRTTGTAPVPAAPSGLSATAVSANSINLQWTDNASNETGFVVEQAAGEGGSYSQVASVGTDVTSALITGLTESTAFFFRVCACNEGGYSAYSDAASATTPATVPLAPSALSAATVSSSSVALQWTDNSFNESGFVVERAPSESGQFVAVASVGAGSTAWTDTGLAEYSTYYYRVKAHNSAGSSLYSATASAMTPASVPADPGNLVATAMSTSRIDLSWVDNSANETGFRIERSLSPSGPFALIQLSGTGATSYSNTGLSASTTYFYRVCAVNANVTSAYSNTASATTSGTAPVAPSNLVAAAVSTSRIDLSWADNASNESGYKVLRKGPDGKTVIFMLPPNAAAYSDTGLSASTTYAYQVCAYNAVGVSAYAGPASATTRALPPKPPSAPELLSALPISSSEIRLTWRDTAWNESGFIVESSEGNDLSFLETARPLPDTEVLDDGGLEEGTAYFYRVCAINDDGASVFTSTVSAVTKLHAPTNLDAVVTTSGGTVDVNLTWRDNSAREAHYVVERAGSESGPWGESAVLATLPANTTSYSDKSCLPESVYFYKVYATGSISDPTNIKRVVTPGAPPEPINPQWVGKTPVIGEAYWVAMAGDYAYVTSSTGLQVVDISDPTNPLVKGSVELAYPYDVVTNGDGYVYVGSSKSLKVIDVQDPTNPAVVASLAMPDYVFGLCLSGDKLYVANYLAGLAVVDIRNHYSPCVLGAMDTPGQANAVSVENDIAVVADGSGGIHAVDVRDPYVPRLAGSLATADNALDVQLRQGIAYVAARNAGVLVVNCTNPQSVSLLGQSQSSGAASGICLSGSLAYVANSSYAVTCNGLDIHDISSPSAPAKLSFSAVCGSIRGGVAIRDSVVCLAARTSGLNLISVENPAVPVVVANLAEADRSYGVCASGNLVYATSQSSLYIYDVTQPSRPLSVGYLQMEAPSDLAVDERGYAYVCDSKSLKVVDVSNPGRPVLVSGATMNLLDYVFGICISGNLAYVARYLSGLVVIDISDPENPRQLGAVDTPGQAFAVSVSGSLAAIADGSGGLQIADISNCMAPVIVGSFATSANAYDVVFAGDDAYVAATYSGMYVVNLTDVRSRPGIGVPSLISNTITRGSATGICLLGQRAFVAGCSYSILANGLQVFDISSPSSPSEQAFLTSGVFTRSVAAYDRTVLLTDDNCLLRIGQF